MKGLPEIPVYPHRRRVESLVHCVCRDCGWNTTGRLALTRAAQHARWNYHRVHTAQTIVTEYVPRRTARKARS